MAAIGLHNSSYHILTANHPSKYMPASTLAWMIMFIHMVLLHIAGLPTCHMYFPILPLYLKTSAYYKEFCFIQSQDLITIAISCVFFLIQNHLS